MAQRVVIYEWASSGGLSGPDRLIFQGDETVMTAIKREGRAMLMAVCRDLARDDRFEPVVLLVEGDFSLPDRCQVVRVAFGEEIHALEKYSAEAPWTLPIAPETKGVLQQRVHRIEQAGGRAIAPSADWIAVAADKHRTIGELAARGIAVPAGRSVNPGEMVPPDFIRPMVIKADASVGCDGLEMVFEGQPSLREESTRVEALCAGQPVSVACLVGLKKILCLPACLQRISIGPQENHPSYKGGEVPIALNLAKRAERLAYRAVTAMKDATAIHGSRVIGWIGVDLILGDREDGRDDRVLEINPRITTSIVGLVELSHSSLIGAMIDLVEGSDSMADLVFQSGCRMRFDASGTVDRICDDDKVF